MYCICRKALKGYLSFDKLECKNKLEFRIEHEKPVVRVGQPPARTVVVPTTNCEPSFFLQVDVNNSSKCWHNLLTDGTNRIIILFVGL